MSIASIEAREAEEPSPLPVGWAWAQLADLGKWTGGGTPSKSVDKYWRDGTVPWVSPKDMKFDIIRNTEDRITEEAVEHSATKYVAAGSVLMVMRSGILRHTFPVAINAERVTLNQDLRALTLGVGIDPNFIAHYLRNIQRWILHNCSKDGTTVQSVDVSSLEKIHVPIAPLSEQRRIVIRIDELFAEIAEGEAALQQARDGLDTWRRALLKAAATGDLTRDWRRASGTRRGGEQKPLGLTTLPQGWTWTTIGDAGDVLLGRQRAPQHHDGPNMRPYLRVANVLEDRIDVSDVKTMNFTPVEFERYRLREGDILLNEGQSRDLVGRSAIYTGGIPECCFQKTLLRFRASNVVNAKFAQIIFLHYLHSGRFSRAAPVTTNMAHLTLERLIPIEFPLPPLDEQNAIVDRYEEAKAALADVKAETMPEDGGALRQAVLKRAFEGQLVSQDENDEPASILLARVRAEAARAVSRAGWKAP